MLAVNVSADLYVVCRKLKACDVFLTLTKCDPYVLDRENKDSVLCI